MSVTLTLSFVGDIDPNDYTFSNGSWAAFCASINNNLLWRLSGVNGYCRLTFNADSYATIVKDTESAEIDDYVDWLKSALVHVQDKPGAYISIN